MSNISSVSWREQVRR